MKSKPNYWVLGYALMAMIASLFAMGYLPDVVPIHWNLQGEVDGYGSKYLYLLFGSLGLLGYVLIGFLRSVDPYHAKINKNLPAYLSIRNIVSALLSTMSIVSLLLIFIQEIDASQTLSLVVGLFMVALGNVLPRVPHNFFSGIRTPWALCDERNWKKTQRFGGFGLVFGGGLMIIGGLFQISWMIGLAFSFIILMAVLSVIYSWYLYKQKQQD